VTRTRCDNLTDLPIEKRAMSLDGQRVVIIGGTSGIGLASATAAAREGAAVVIVSSNHGRVRDAVEQLPGATEGQVVDVTSEHAVRELFDRLGAFDHLVYTAGEPLALEELQTLRLERARAFFEIRYFGALAAVKHASSTIRPGGSIVLSSGSAGARPQKGWTVAASITGATEALTRALAVELAPVRVNAVAPGVVRTALWDGIPQAEREAFYNTVGEAMLTGRVGEPDEIAQTHVYLMRDRFITGAVIPVDGGARLV
jgi:NAD(P)-dependent dehydrogenase (short-subunit alcohol dehydrogenase family)